MAFPPGVSTFKAVLDATGPDGRPVSGHWTMQIETPLVWAATGQLLVDVSQSRWAQQGHMEFELPHTDQSGFTAGAGGDPVTNWGYRFYFQPIRARQMSTDTYVRVPASMGAVVPVGNLLNIGAWPNQSVVVTPAPAGAYTPVTVLGSSGYWSPA